MLKKLLDAVKKLLLNPQPGCSVYCPSCRRNLVLGWNQAEYTYDARTGLVYYRCVCDEKSVWDFSPPVPVRIR